MANVKSYAVALAVIFGFVTALNAATRHQNVSRSPTYVPEQVVPDSEHAVGANFQDRFKGY